MPQLCFAHTATALFRLYDVDDDGKISKDVTLMLPVAAHGPDALAPAGSFQSPAHSCRGQHERSASNAGDSGDSVQL